MRWRLLCAGWLALPAAQPVHAQYTVTMRAMVNPLPVGQCTVIEVVALDARGWPPTRPDGRQVDWQEFELEFTSAPPDAFTWGDQRHRQLCALASTAATAVVVARYPGRQVLPANVIPGLVLEQSVAVAIASGAGPSPAASAGSPPGPPGYSAANPAANGSVPQVGSAPTPAGYSPAAPVESSPVAPVTSPPAPVGYSTANPGTPPPAGHPPTAPNQGAVPPGPAPVASSPLAATPSAASAASPPPPAPAPKEAQASMKGFSGLFKKVTGHIKQTASDVTSETARNIATGAENVVDASMASGAGVVSSAALEATNSARSAIGGVGRSLTPVALRGGASSDNLATVMAAGGAELRMLRFTGTTDVLEPASRDLITRLAAALNATQGNFVIEGHVDPLSSPAASQELSEHRAAAVKAALIRNGVAAQRLKALGYGASEPKPEVPPEGGAPSSARIVVAREPAP